MAEYFLIGSLCMAFGFVAGLITAEKHDDDEDDDNDHTESQLEYFE